jgi:hypothetical protein
MYGTSTRPCSPSSSAVSLLCRVRHARHTTDMHTRHFFKEQLLLAATLPRWRSTRAYPCLSCLLQTLADACEFKLPTFCCPSKCVCVCISANFTVSKGNQKDNNTIKRLRQISREQDCVVAQWIIERLPVDTERL